MSQPQPPKPLGVERQSSDSLDIPSRTVVLKDASELPNSYSMTPGGTMYSTTPGGTRIIYDRKFLLQMRNSPYSRTPPVRLATIPDIIAEGTVTVPPTTKSPDPIPPQGFSDAEVTKLKSSVKPKNKEQQKFTGQTDSVNTSLTVGFSDPEVTSDKPKILPIEKATLSKQTEDVNTSLPTEDFTTSENCLQLEVNKSDCTTLENDIIKEELSDQEDDIFSNRHQASLDEMHQQQEEVKKENLKRKMVLQQALKNRYKESSREVETLKIVQQELTKLDNLVTEDIAILRNKIEETNKLYNSARKRFEEAEKEYVSSKLLLHEIKEKKELLSEHLYTIIQNNESRKAQKLTQLMSTLHIEDNIDDNVLTHSSHIEGQVTSGDSQRVLPVDNIPLGASMISIQRLD